MKDNESCQILAARQENPFFNRSAVHNPALFIGREELIRKIFSRIISAKPQSISLFGERRIGKSSILSQINSPLIQGKYISNPEKYIFAYIDFQQFVQANPINFFKTLLKLLSLDPKSPEIRKTESNGYNEFSEFLNSCKTGEIKLVLLFDEFEKITKNPSFNVEFYAFLRSVANNFDVAFITSSFAVLQDLCHSNQIADSPFFNIFSSFRIRPFTQAECETLIEHYLEYTSATFSFKDYYKTIFADTGFLPFFLQIYCSILYERLSMKTSFTIESISEEFLEESKAHFSFIWTTLPEQEKNLIIKIILQKQISIKDEYVVKNLILKGYIFKTDDSYILFSLSFRTFLINKKAFIEDKRKFLKGTGNKNLGVFGLINKRKLKLFSIALAFVCIVLLGIVLKKRFDVPTPSNTIENKIVVSRGVTLIYDKASKNYIKVGKFYALLIGIEKYEDSFYPTLTEPLNDVTELKSVLISKYTFDSTNVRVLQNPSKNEIFRALIFYRDSLTPDDNLFVFYAGHGCYDKKADMGYLIPSDADNKNDATWVSYQDIRSKFNVIEAKHILLIADACFAGSVFRSVDSIRPEHVDAMTRERISTRSRTAFTSADLKPVPDKSEFLKYLTSALENNLSPLLLSEDLYINTRNTLKVGTSKKDPVKWGALQDCNDMGGDFVFVRRSDSANLSN